MLKASVCVLIATAAVIVVTAWNAPVMYMCSYCTTRDAGIRALHQMRKEHLLSALHFAVPIIALAILLLVIDGLVTSKRSHTELNREHGLV